MSFSSQRLWTGDFILAWGANFLMGFSFYLLLPVLPFYLVDRFHSSETVVGIVMSVYVVAALFMRPFSGYLVDSFSRRLVYLTSYLFFVLLIAGYFIASTVLLLFLLRAVHGLTWGVITTSSNTVAIDIMPHEKRGSGIGLYGLSLTLSMAFAPVLGLALHKSYGIQSVFIGSFSLAIVGLLLAIFICIPPRPKVEHSVLTLDRFLLVKGIPLGINLLFISFTFGILLSFAALFGQERGINRTGLFFMIMAFGMAFARIVSGKTIDKGGLLKLITASLILLTIGFVLYVLAFSIYLYCISAVIIGLGYGILSPGFQTMFVNMGSHQERGTANSTFLTAFDLGVGAGMVMAGLIAHYVGLTAAFSVSVFAAFIALLVFVKYVKPYYLRNASV